MLDTLVKHLHLVRLSVGAAGLVLLVLAAGCVGTISGEGDSGETPEQRAAVDAWVNKALPAFQQGTCTTCHNGSQAQIGFLAGDSDIKIRTTLLGFDPQVVNLDAVQSSRVLTKGVHAGPALTAQQTSDILTWLQAEQVAAGGGSGGTSTDITTTPFQFELCTSGVAGDPTCPVNHVDISALSNAPALPGAHIDFVVQPLANDIYVTDLYANTGVDGLYIEHPLFVYIPPTGQMCANGLAPPCPDNIDRFFDVQLDMMGGSMQQPIGGGTAAFTGFAPVQGAQLQITFKVVDKYRDPNAGGGGGGGTISGGCKVTTQFTQMVVPQMINNNASGNHCSGCHMGQNQAATSAMDITGIETTTDATKQQAACNQVRTRIDFTNIPNSGVILAPEQGQDGAHPFKLAAGDFTNFQNAVVSWANAEKTAQ